MSWSSENGNASIKPEARPDPVLVDRVRRALGRRPIGWTPVIGRGYTPTARWVVALDDGSSAFAKVATNGWTAQWLRAEHRVYASLGTRQFLPRFLGWDEDGLPLLLLEDLSSSDWPPPWSDERVALVQRGLDEVHASPVPGGVPDLQMRREELSGWKRLAEDPGPFLSLGLCSRGWLDRALPVLMEAEAKADLAGGSLLHFDVRSDNICFVEGRTVFVDWSDACRGNPLIDVVGWLPSLEREGGPRPDEVLDGEPELVAAVAGYFASMAGLTPPEGAVRVREVQLDQLRSALPWAVRALSLEPPRAQVRGPSS